MTQTSDEAAWYRDRDQNNWTLPKRAPWFFRLPIIRHIRVIVYAIRVERWYTRGPGALGAARTGYDKWVLYAIARGWC